MAQALRENLRTKIVATLGPATAEPGKLESLLEAGVDVCRLNFSHGDHETHLTTLKRVRDWAEMHQRPIAVLGDLCGPKIRVNRISGGEIKLLAGQRVTFRRGDDEGTADALTVSYPRFVDEVEVGHRVYIDDGVIRLLVIEQNSDTVVCTCTAGGTVSSRKGLNLPDTRLTVPALTEKDKIDALWAIEHQLDYIALSFVRRPSDLRELKKILDDHDSDMGTIVKVEKFEALEHIEDLVAMADGVMVARGDLGVEMDVWQVPLVQKGLTARCRDAGKPVIIATQMLQNMITAPTPTRAEVSDVANAILDGVDAVMMSAETASGAYPLSAVEVMRRVGEVTEAYRAEAHRLDTPSAVPIGDGRVSAIAEAAAKAALHLGARLIAIWTTHGDSARMAARYRLPIPVVALTNDVRVYRRMNLLYGVMPMLVQATSNPADMSHALDEQLMSTGLAAPGDLVVLVISTQPTVRAGSDTLLIHRVEADASSYT